jgi:hypothetical protein
MTREEILQAIKEAVAQRADLQQRRRELRAQLEETP